MEADLKASAVRLGSGSCRSSQRCAGGCQSSRKRSLKKKEKPKMLLSSDDAMLLECDSTVFRKSGCCLSVENLNSRHYGNQLRETMQIADMKQAGYTRFWDVRWFSLLWLIHVGFGFKSVAAVLCPPPASVCLSVCLSAHQRAHHFFFFSFFKLTQVHTPTHG